MRIIYACSIFGLILCGLMGCGNGEFQPVKVFRYNQSSGISSLDPAFAKDQAGMWAVNQLFNGLVQMDDSMQVRPCIAHSWMVSEDGKRYTFYLRRDVYFHDNPIFEGGRGPRLVASDVAYSFSRLVDTVLASPGAWVFNGKIADKNPFVALNDSTFQLNLNQAFPPLLGILTMQYCSIVPKAIVSAMGRDFRIMPVGTGPFRFKLWHENEVLVLVRNNNYFERDAEGQQLPYIDGVKVSFMDNKRNEYLKFTEGKFDMLSGIDVAWKDDLLSPEGQLVAQQQEKINLLRTPYLNTEYLGILQQGKVPPALTDKRVRQAINYGIDRPKMLRYLRNNVGVPATHGFVPPVLPPFDQKPTQGYTYNPDLAGQLLQAAGYGKAKPLTGLSLETTASYQDIAIFVQKQLAEISILVNVQLNTGPLLRERAAKGEVPLFRASWVGDYPDAENYLAVLYGQSPAPPNYTRFNNRRYDEWYREALNKPALREQLYRKMDSLLVLEAPIIPLYYDEVLRFVNKRVKNLGINGFNMLHLKQVRLE